MSADLNMNGTNALSGGTVIFEKGETVQSVALILKGRVTIQTEGAKMVLGSGNFLGIYDVEAGKHSFTYTTVDDVVVYGLPVSTMDQARLLLEEKDQYRGLLVTSVNFMMSDLNKIFNKLKSEMETLTLFVMDLYQKYLSLVEKSGLVPEKISSIERLAKNKPETFSLPANFTYYLHCSKIPVEAQRNFFGANAFVAGKHFMEQCKILPSIIEGCRFYGESLYRYFRTMIMDEKNLFTLIGKMALNIKKSGQDIKEFSGMLDSILSKINDTEKVLIETAGIATNLQRGKMEEIYFALLSDDTGSLEAYEKEDLQVLSNSLSQILDYAPVHVKISGEFREAVDEFFGLADKFARTPEATAVRKKVARNFFEIYEAVVKKSFSDSNPPLAVRLFLQYGYVSEELLTEDELRTLLTLPEIDNDALACKVYTMPMWLREIYEGRRNPSKDEFDMDYEEHLRKEVSEHKREKKTLEDAFNDPDARLHFEVDNLLRYADRVISGNISAFVPVLCSEGLYSRIENAVVTGAAINTAVTRVEKVDYSIFYRESMDSYEKAEITRFVNVERYTPEFILFPVYGRNGLMWQDIEGRRKTTHGRVLLPVLMEQNLEQEIMKMLAYFRWEKCRTDMGAQWNNYRYPSLTSEYTDYLQFYKKNQDLTIEKKEKVKAQLQQCNNRHRDVFAKDYQDWILREAVGAMRLNRVARDIMFTYCPLSSEIASGLITQNSYQEAARRYMTERRKKEKSIQTTMKRFEKLGMDVPEEIERTRKYVLES